ncbi:MAG: hypothetical protein AAF497_07055, partial [Planctomycetota bacterium]
MRSRTFLFVLLTALVSSAASANEAVRLLKIADDSTTSGESYEVQIKNAKAVLDLANQTNNLGLSARALIRMAYIETTTGKWSPEWTKWREQAINLTKNLNHPDVARAEVEGLGGYLDAMYMKKVKEGILSLQTAISSAEAMGDDALLARLHFLLGRVIIFDGQSSKSLESLRLSAKFARLNQDLHAEYNAYRRLFVMQKAIGAKPDPETLDRFRETASQLGYRSDFLMSAEERIAYLKELVADYDQLNQEEGAPLTAELKNCSYGSLELIYHYLDLENWEEAERYIHMQLECAKMLQNQSSVAQTEFLRVGLLARRGEMDLVDSATQQMIDALKSEARDDALREKCTWMARQCDAGGGSSLALRL